MKLKQIPLALALVIGVLASGCTQETTPTPATAVGTLEEATPTQAATDSHVATDADHAEAVAHAAGADFPLPANHVAWTPDAPLIEGMSRVRAALAGLEPGDAARPDAATVEARAGDIDAAIKYMFANCKLDTQPDIALHAVLARLMAGTQALHANPADTTPVHDMHAAMENYKRLFDDPA